MLKKKPTVMIYNRNKALVMCCCFYGLWVFFCRFCLRK